jgi:hypothetical protein
MRPDEFLFVAGSKYVKMLINLNQNAIEYMNRLGFRDAVLMAEKFTT